MMLTHSPGKELTKPTVNNSSSSCSSLFNASHINNFGAKTKPNYNGLIKMKTIKRTFHKKNTNALQKIHTLVGVITFTVITQNTNYS